MILLFPQSFFTLLNSDFYIVTWLLADFCPYVLSKTYDITHRTIRIFYSHIDNTPVIRLSVESCMDFYPAFAELFFQIIWEFYIRAVYFGDLFLLQLRIRRFWDPYESLFLK